MMKKSVFFLFFKPPSLLVCVFSLTELKRRNHQNVLFYVVQVFLTSMRVNELRCPISYPFYPSGKPHVCYGNRHR